MTIVDVDTSATVCTFNIDGAGNGSCFRSNITAGTHHYRADFAGNSELDASSSTVETRTISQANTSINLGSNIPSNTTVYGQSVTFEATVSVVAPGAGVPTGTVTFTDNGTTIGTGTLDSSGLATLTVSNLAVGAHTNIGAAYASDGNYNSAFTNGFSHSVQKADTATVTSHAPSSTLFGQSVTFTATVSAQSPGAGTPTGTVTFNVDGSDQSPTSLTAGTATLTLTNLSAGSHSVKAKYNGDGNFNLSVYGNTVTHTVNQAFTSTSISPSPNPSAAGATVTISAQVNVTAPGAGTRTGTVEFFDGLTSLGSGTLNGSGQASLSVPLAPGTHVLRGVYSGDANFSTSTSPTAVQVVNPAPTTTTMSATSAVVVGQQATVTATVTSAYPGTITGIISFYDGATLIGNGSVSGGSVTTTVFFSTAGSHSITALYQGTPTYATSTSSAVTQTVNQASTITVLNSSTNPSVFGQPVTLTATVVVPAPGFGTLTGSVQFKDGATLLGTGTLNGSGVATLTTSSLSTGSHSVTATYAGDANFLTSTSTGVNQTVNQASTTTALASSPNPSVFGQSVTFTATVAASAPGAGVATGSVQFKEGANVLGTGTLTGGTASFSTASLAIGSHSVTATYLGDANFATSTSSAANQVVNQAATTTALVSSLNPSTYSNSVTFTATVSVTAPGAGTPTGTVTFKDGAATLASGTLNGSRVATFSTSALTGGSHSITATYNADANFSGSTSSTVAQVVNKAATSTALTSSGPGLTTSTQTFTATVTSAAGTPTGTVSFTDGQTVLGTSSVNNAGVATVAVYLSAGVHTVVAKYNGDTNFNTSTSAGNTVGVGKPDTITSTPVLRSGTPNPGETLTFAATVTGNGRVTGSVTFRDFNVVIGTGAVDAQGTAVISARLALGNHMIVAYYEGDPTNNSSTSDALFLTVRGSVTVTLTSSANPSAAGASVTFTAAVASATTGGPAVTGTVSFTDGTRALGSATLANGQASVTATDLASGDHTIVASYSGDTVYQSANSAPLTQKVDRERTSTTLDAGVDANGYFLLAAVSPAGEGTPTGAVSFEDANTNATLGSGTLANGKATLRLAVPLPVGHRLRAVYAGDTRYANSTSTAVPFIAAANAFSFAFSFAPDSIVSIFGSDLADATVAAPSLPLPTTLGGVTVKIVDGAGVAHNAPIYFVSAGQINIVVPGDLAPGPARLLLTRGSVSISLLIVKSAPSLASADGSGSGPAAAHILRVHADGGQDPLVVVTGAGVPFGSQTDSLYLILYGSGFRSGQGATSCALNGQPVNALYAGPHATYPGLDQINIQIPGSLRGAGSVTVNCAVAGQTSNTVTINVQ